MQSERVSHGYEDVALTQFKKLIEDFKDGYDSNSEIELDSQLMLIDGSHRIALALYFGVKELSCKVRAYKANICYGITWFMEHGFSLSEMKLILSKSCELFDDQLKNISCILWPPVHKYFDEITEKLNLLYDVRNVKDFNFKDEPFARVVRAIYSVDDIEKWKIDKKIEGMMPYPKVIRMMEIAPVEPNFRLKAVNSHTLSVEGERIKSIIRNAYKGKVDNYFYDIIVHTGDNYSQSQSIANFLIPHFSLREYFELIKEYKYVAIKIDTENLPDDFPDSYPFGKDLDIICAKDCAERLVDDTIAFAQKRCLPDLSVRHIIEGTKNRIRVEQEDQLIFQFDINVELEGLSGDFVGAALKNRRTKDNYYIPSMEDELIFRAWEGAIYGETTAGKLKHIDYILSYMDSWNPQKAKWSLSFSLWEKLQKLLEARKSKI